MEQTTSQGQVAKKKIYKKWWFWVIAIIVFIVIIPKGGKSGNTSSSGTNVETSSEPAAISVSATKLMSDYKANEVAADNSYKGKILEVTGVIDKIGKEVITDKPYVDLKTNEMLGSIQCYFPENPGELASLSQGQSLRVHGKCDGLMMNVQLKDCTIIK